MAIVAASGEYAVAWRHDRMLALQLVPAGMSVARHAGLKPHLTTVISGGTKVLKLEFSGSSVCSSMHTIALPWTGEQLCICCMFRTITHV